MAHDPLALLPLRKAATVPAVTAEQMREIDRLAVDDAHLSRDQMLENAGRLLAEVVRAYLDRDADAPDRRRPARGPTLILAGAGRNGAGALAAARHLRNGGRTVQVVLGAQPSQLGGLAQRQHYTLHRDGVRSLWPAAPEFDAHFPAWMTEAAVVVDGLVGAGLTGPLRGDVAVLVEAVLDRAPPVVISLDVPTGVDATTGAVHSSGVVATATLTLALPKTGLLQGEATAAVGELLLADIGIPHYIYARLGLPDLGDLFAAGPLLRLLPAG